MIQARNTTRQQHSEGGVITANKKHQILLNMELKRIEMEKKMREKYFNFELTLMKARSIKIVDRQKSLGIHCPKLRLDNSGCRRIGGESFFFTQRTVKLPSLLEKRDIYGGFSTKVANSKLSPKIYQLSKNVCQSTSLENERERRPHFAVTKQKKRKTDGQIRSHHYLKTRNVFQSLNKNMTTDCNEGRQALLDIQELSDTSKTYRDLFVTQYEGPPDTKEKATTSVRDTDKNSDHVYCRKGQSELSSVCGSKTEESFCKAVQGDFPKGNPQRNIAASRKGTSHRRENRSKERYLDVSVTGCHGEIFNRKGRATHFEHDKQKETKSTKAQGRKDFRNFQELEAWHGLPGQSIPELNNDSTAICRPKSATGYLEVVELKRRDLAFMNATPRSQSSLARY